MGVSAEVINRYKAALAAASGSAGSAVDAFRKIAPTAPTVTLRRFAPSAVAASSACVLYDSGVRQGASAAILASLKAKCAAEQATASAGATAPAEAPAAGMSPVVIGAIGVGLLVVAFVGYSAFTKKGKKKR